MKKGFAYLIVLGVLFFLPLAVNAATSASINDKPDSETTNSDGTITKYYSIYISTTNNEELSSADFGFRYGTAITNFVCEGAGDFELGNQETTGSNQVTCNFTVPSEGTSGGAKILVGKLAVTVNKDSKDEDCTIEYSYDGSTGKINPQTGSFIPYATIAGGIVIAAGIYFVTKKRTKFSRI